MQIKKKNVQDLNENLAVISRPRDVPKGAQNCPSEIKSNVNPRKST